MTRVVVLMSTYQGERFVAEQLESILDQLPPEGRIQIRDDGSTDRTVTIIEALPDARVMVRRGVNVGFSRSFLSLIDEAPTDADVYMLADQDDVWLPDKIARASRYLQTISGDLPALYCSRLQLVDTGLNRIGLSPRGPRQPSFETALAENIVVGCTAAFNRAAFDRVRQFGDPALIYFHDWWLYLVTAAFGVVHFDPEPTALYRQHGGNVLGMGSGVRRYWTILRFLRSNDFVRIMFNQIENFRAVHGGTIRPEQLSIIDRYYDPHSRSSVLRLIFSTKRNKRRLLDEVLLRGLLAFSVVTGRRVFSGQANRRGNNG